MAFVTDLIWRSPLGLRINAQATADVLMTEDWVKVRGDQLAPRDGAYDLRDHRGAVGDALLRSRLAAGRRSSRRAPRCSSTSASRCRRRRSHVDRHRAGPAVRRRSRDDHGHDVVGARRARGTTATSTSPAAARYQGITRDALRRARAARRGAADRPAVARRAGLGASDRQLDQRGDRPGRARARPRACRCRSPTRAGRFRDVRDRPRLSRRARTRRC